MLLAPQAKTARGKRIQTHRQSKVIENVKSATMIRGHTSNQLMNRVLADLYALKKPHAVHYTKKNQSILPFEDASSIEFYGKKNDTSLFMISSHSKKRPHNLVMGRLFDFQLMDMMELGVEKYVGLEEIKGSKCGLGLKPVFVFNGEVFEQVEEYQKLKNMFIDFYRGEVVESTNLTGLEHVISVSANPNGLIHFRVYTIQLVKSGQRTPRVELTEMGPSIDFRLRRKVFSNDDMMKQATRIPKELKPKKVKNVKYDDLGNQMGRIYVEKQDMSKLQTRKMKGLKAHLDPIAESDKEGEQEVVDMEE